MVICTVYVHMTILMLKEWRKIRHGYMYGIRTYDHGAC